VHFAIDITVNPFLKASKYAYSLFIVLHRFFSYVGSKIAKDNLDSYFYSGNDIDCSRSLVLLHIDLSLIKSNVPLLE